MSDYYDIDGNPIGMLDWVVFLESRDMTEYGRIAEDIITVRDETTVRVSTIWLGLDHNFDWITQPHIPLIFETMVFGLNDAEGYEFQWRYPTKESALAGHDQAVALVKEHLHAC